MYGNTSRPEDIAVVGLGLRFPGNATSPAGLWDVLSRKESQWSEFPEDRLNIDGYFHPSGRRQGGISFKGAHFLKEDIASFDAAFFSIPAEEAAAIDPQQRILLEVSYEALENAGLRKEDIDGSDCAVYVGSFVKDYEQICLRDPDWSPQYAATGNGIAIMANRISYAFNLHGPSMTIDTGCSGSLIAVHMAVQTLRTGESSLAIAAGAGMILSPNTIMPMTALNFLSPDGKSFTFDSRANGYGRGEGIGAVILKRLPDALRDNDTIHAVIRSSSTNQDGRTTGITLPSKEAQVANIRNAYAMAGLDFDQTAYVECHGTGTQAGDWRELKAISETIAAGRPSDKPVVVGSVKPNIGHLEGAAGIAGLIKGILTLKHGKIPPQINFEKGNPDIDFEAWRVKVPTETLDWPLPGIRRVSVNCFGFGGSNAHVIMDEAQGYLSARQLKGNHSSSSIQDPTNVSEIVPSLPNAAQLFLYSANHKGGVASVLESHLEVFESMRMELTPEYLQDYSYTLGSRRSTLDWKGFIVADSIASLTSKIRQFDQESTVLSPPGNEPKIGFVFCGQGSQWAQMGKDLMCYRVFSASLNEASVYMRKTLGSPFNLVEEILGEREKSQISYPEIAQPATTALQVALVELLSSFNILPSHVVGHSSGEIAAAFAAGALSREDAWKVAYYRGLAAASIPIRAPKLRGGMAVVGMSLEWTDKYLVSVAKSARVACINSPRSVTISGQEDAIRWIANDLGKKSIFAKVLNVKTAYHSSHMRLVEYDYRDSLGILQTRPTRKSVKMFSSVTGELTLGPELNAEYWVTNLISPVQYVAAIESLVSLPPGERPDILVEISPSATLRYPTTDILMNSKAGPRYYSALERGQAGPESLLRLVGELWSQGCTVNMDNVAGRGFNRGFYIDKEGKDVEDEDDSRVRRLKCLSDFPAYPWNHSKRYWFETHLSRANRFRKYPRRDLIGSLTADSVSFEPRWRGFLRISESPWIQEHQVQKTIIYPAAGIVSMVLEGARQLIAEGDDPLSAHSLLGYELSDFVIEKAMLIPNTAHGLEVALNMRDNGRTGVRDFAVYSKPLDRPWERHATGSLELRHRVGDWEAGFGLHEADYKALEETCTESVVPRQLYEDIDAVGLNYGSSFQNLVEVRRGHKASVGKIRIPDTKSKMPERFEYPHLIHPVTLDAMLHTLLAIDPIPMVPVSIKSLFVSADIKSEAGSIFTGHAITNMMGLRDADATIVMKQPHSRHAYVVIDGLRLSRLSTVTALDGDGEQGGFLANHRNLATQIIWKEDADSASPTSYQEQLDLLAHKCPSLAVLQVGADRSLTLATLGVVTPAESGHDAPRLARYTILTSAEAGAAGDTLSLVKGTPIEPFTNTVTDISTIQAIYHLIITGECAAVEPGILERLLVPGGILLKSSGRPDSHDISLPMTQVYRHQPLTTSEALDDVVLLIPSEPNVEIDGFISALEGLRELNQLPFDLSTISSAELMVNPDIVRGKIVVSALDLLGGFVFHWNRGEFDCFHSLQRQAAAILWITRGAHMLAKNPKGSPIVGLARTLMSEDPLKVIVTLDLGPESRLDESRVVGAFLTVLNATFEAKPGSGPREVEYAEEGGKLYIPRLSTIPLLNRRIEGDDDGNAGAVPSKFHRDDGPGLRLLMPRLGLADDDDDLHYSETEAGEVADDEVEIVLMEAPLSFFDVETMLGRTSASSIGSDVRGRTKRVGMAVTGLAPGDEVTALVTASGGAIQSTVKVKARFVKRIHSGGTAMMPSFYISAYYALVHIGRASRGRKVLIHAGASCFGLAAVDVALAAEAEVFATVVGPDSRQQREMLERRGVAQDHIVDVEAGHLVATLRAAIKGERMDVVYNPTLDHMDADVRIVRKCGSVVQFASTSPSPQVAISRSSSMTNVNFDLGQLLEEDPEFVGELLDGAFRLLDDGRRPISEEGSFHKQLDVKHLKDLLLHIQHAPFLGYTSVTANSDSTVSVSMSLGSSIAKLLQKSLDAGGTYVLSGGLGGLGRSISELLVKNGVGHVAYLSRSGPADESSSSFLASLRSKGVDARSYAVDIGDAAALSRIVKDVISAEMPPIRGVFQCAAVLRDAVFDNMSFDDWEVAVRPKMAGSWNLVQAMDAAGQSPFYVFLASSAGVIGNRGQANYAAGNCFEDSLARHLRLRGTHAVSIDLGPVLGAGMLTDEHGFRLLDILRASGFFGIRHGDFLKVVEHAITGQLAPGVPLPAQVVLGVGTGGLIRQNKPADPYWSRTALYSYLNLVDVPATSGGATETGSLGSDVRSLLARARDVDEAADVVCGGLAEMLARAIKMLPEEMDVDRPPRHYGVDSLVAVGVRNWVLGQCGVQMSVFEILGEATMRQMAREVAERIERNVG